MLSLVFERGVALLQEETYADRTLAHHDRFGIVKMAPVDVDGEIAGCEAGERAMHAALKLVDRRSRTDSFADGEREQLAYPQRRCKSEGRRASGGDGVEIERNPHANHTYTFCSGSRSRLPSRSTVEAMSQFGNIPVQSLVDAVEKHVAKMDEAELASLLRSHASQMSPGALVALSESIFDAFRDRGESSEDAAEGASISLEAIAQGEGQAVVALIDYARANPGVLKESMTFFAEERSDQLSALPQTLLSGIAERLT